MHHGFAFLVLLLSVFSCAKDLAGIDPPQNIFFYPTGIRLSPSGRTIFVTNGNSDLRYNGSTLMALDADRMHVLAADPLSFASCSVDMGNPSEFLCSLDDTLIRTAVRLGSYAGNIAMLPAPENTSIAYRLLVAVRAEPSLTWVDVYEDAEGRVTCLDCGSGCDASWPRDCRDTHKITKQDGLAADPFRILTFDDLHYAVVTHLNSPYLTVVDYAVDPPMVSQVLDAHMAVNINGNVGSYDIVRGPEAQPTFYVSNSYASEIAWFTWQYFPDLGREFVIPVGSMYLQSPWGPYESGSELRGLSFSMEGHFLHAAMRYPPAVVTFDVIQDSQARTKLIPVGTTEVSSQPGLMQMHGINKEYLFVTSFPEGEIVQFDPQFSTWVQRIPVGLGPHEFLFFPEARGIGMYVVNFAEGTLSMVSFDGTWRRLGRFGTPKRIGKD